MLIRHSSFRVGSERPVKGSVEIGVQNMDVGKPLNVVREEESHVITAESLLKWFTQLRTVVEYLHSNFVPHS